MADCGGVRSGGYSPETCMMMYQTHADFGQGEIDQRAHRT
jgi:hypothetical protein